MPLGKHNSRRAIAPLLLLILAWTARARAQSTLPPSMIEARPDQAQVLEKLVEKNAERAEALRKYQGRRFYSLDYKSFFASFHAEMIVDMTYDAPSTKQFKIVSQSGSAWVIDRILKKLLEAELEAMSEENRSRTALNSSNYDFSGFEQQDTPDNCSYVLAVEPKIASKLLYRGRIWVDRKDFAVCRIEAEPAKNPSFWIKSVQIHHSYLKVGDFWLPSENESVSAVRGGGRAVLTIKYLNYEILAARSLKGNDAGPSASSLSPANRSD